MAPPPVCPPIQPSPTTWDHTPHKYGVHPPEKYGYQHHEYEYEHQHHNHEYEHQHHEHEYEHTDYQEPEIEGGTGSNWSLLGAGANVLKNTVSWLWGSKETKVRLNSCLLL